MDDSTKNLSIVFDKIDKSANMKIIEEYAQRKVDEKTEVIIRNLNEEGYGINDIARIARVSLDFVEKTLAK